MRLSVITVNWNSRADLRACLLSLEKQHGSEALETIVVDNGSTDGSLEMVREEFPRVTLLPQGENLGFAEGCNRGIAASSGEWVVLLNNDAWAEPGWAEALLRAAREHASDEVAMLQSLMLFQGRPDVVNSTGIRLASNGSGVDRGEGQPRSRYTKPEEIFCPTGGAAAYRRDVLEQLRLSTGYLDRHYFLYYEDLDLGWRARLAGYRAHLVPDAVVHHRYHGSTDRLDRHQLRVYTSSNRIRTLLKNASPSFLAWVLPSVSQDVARVVMRGGSRDLRALGLAALDGLQMRSQVDRLMRRGRREVERCWVDR